MSRVTDLLANSVRRVLLEEWDPIGIKGIPEAQDEYDSYVLKICGMLRADCSAEGLCKHLRWIETEQMGLDGDELHTSEIAKKLVGLDVSGDV
ncbi:hypothetical protein [Burkholderia gladioli]|uniref:Uncharacterized protein n=1 Tax=Burkholderia gladioli TaxID=28095 RepID=A0A2A7S0G2_BURGA|nr:hypothetical protein [Burkholderia gladioli]MBA1362076.1 hypothetical protein [Burkholderia gladioli]MBU9426666.1 hypothetical protein [Burkholderia gladioli]MDN8063373.1 hypothetical protein [Burkholderia gladioli]PEH36795.1 hypothetical protein CRM94_19505 [Burkholderia gladioli]QPQ83179.1 hypothetical protein I6H08_18225 [Burkholderia gladioli]